MLKFVMPCMIGCGGIDDRVGHIRFEREVRLAVLLRAADERRRIQPGPGPHNAS